MILSQNVGPVTILIFKTLFNWCKCGPNLFTYKGQQDLDLLAEVAERDRRRLEKLLQNIRFFSIHIASNRLTARCFYSGFFFAQNNSFKPEMRNDRAKRIRGIGNSTDAYGKPRIKKLWLFNIPCCPLTE